MLPNRVTAAKYLQKVIWPNRVKTKCIIAKRQMNIGDIAHKGIAAKKVKDKRRYGPIG